MATKNAWDAPPNNPNAHWVKTRELVGTSFRLVKVRKGMVKARPSYIFEAEDGALFSVGIDSTIGKQIGRSGTPPTPNNYTIVQRKSEKSPSGYSLSLKPAAEA